MNQHVIVVGGGIAGSATALALRTAGIDVTVIESRPAGQDTGAVVRLNPNGMDALRAIDAHQLVIANSFPALRADRYSPDGRRVSHRLLADPTSERGLPRILAWAELARVLREQALCAGATFRHETRVVATAANHPAVTATLADGDTVEGDVLVGADGTHSSIRPHIDPKAPAPLHCATRTIYGYTPRPTHEPPPAEALRFHSGRTAFFAIIRDAFTGGCYWFTNLPTPDADSNAQPSNPDEWRDHLCELFHGDRSPAVAIIEGADRVLAFDDHALPHLPRWHDQRRIVIGDAAHVAPPSSEQGASMALEDGVILAQAIRDCRYPEEGLAAFERIRRKRVEDIVALGIGGGQRVHARGARALEQIARRRITGLLARRGDDRAEYPSAYDHHIDWQRPLLRAARRPRH